MKIILIAALNNNRVIGKNGAIPWHIPEDLKRFKLLTIHNTVLMGRKTFAAIGRLLPDRNNVIISKTAPSIDGALTFRSLEEALSHLHEKEKIFVIGGENIFQQTIDRADELLLTIVDNDEAGDAYFPKYEHLIGMRFTLFHEETMKGFQFKDYRRLDN